MSSHHEGTVLLLAASFCTAVLAACAGPASVERREGKEAEDEKIVEKYEAQFHPSEYDPPIEVIKNLVRVDTSEKADEEKTRATPPHEMIPGFRIQVLSTTEIDTANQLKEQLSSLPEHLGIYVIYDSPYYKVRVGDFPTRLDANPVLNTLIELGYTDAWIVADRVIKDPPRRSPPRPERNDK